MTQTKYFVIFTNDSKHSMEGVHNCLSDARAAAERYAMDYPGRRFLIAVETQSVIGTAQVNWTDK